jgi:hypothetical protein
MYVNIHFINTFLSDIINLMKIRLLIITFFLLAILPLVLAKGVSAQEDSRDTLVITGKGYPPIRAENPAQARLMAKRAAVVDAYRNAVAAKSGKTYKGDIEYSQLEGFVKGMTVMSEEYLKDGGMRITAKVPTENVMVTSHSIVSEGQLEKDDTVVTGKSTGAIMPTPPREPQEPAAGTAQVSVSEWYRIIEKYVRYDY